MRVYKNVKTFNLKSYSNNSRIHSENQINQIAGSIKEFGFTNPCLIDSENNLIAGHGRLEAAKKLKLSEVPCIVIDDLTKAQKVALIIADNKIALNSNWDFELLKIEIDFLTEENFNLDLTGFDSEEIEGIFDNTEQNEFIEQKNISCEKLQIIVDCISEKEQQNLLSRLTKDGYKCKKMN